MAAADKTCFCCEKVSSVPETKSGKTDVSKTTLKLDSGFDSFHTPQTKTRKSQVVFRQTPSKTAPQLTTRIQGNRSGLKTKKPPVNRRAKSEVQTQMQVRRRRKRTTTGTNKKSLKLSDEERSETHSPKTVDGNETNSPKARGEKTHAPKVRGEEISETLNSDTETHAPKARGEEMSALKAPDKKDYHLSDNKENDAIQAQVFYGTRSVSAKKQHLLQPQNIPNEDQEKKISRVLRERMDQLSAKGSNTRSSARGRKSELRKKNSRKRKHNHERCFGKKGTVDIKRLKKCGREESTTAGEKGGETSEQSSLVRLTNHADWAFGWSSFRHRSLFSDVHHVDPLDAFFTDGTSSAEDDPAEPNQGFETVQRTLRNMRAAATGGMFSSPFSSSLGMSKLLQPFAGEANLDLTEFSDTSSQRSEGAGIEQVTSGGGVGAGNSDLGPETGVSCSTEREQRPAAVSPPPNTEPPQEGGPEVSGTFLSDMFGSVTPPGHKKKTPRRLCASGDGQRAGNFQSMFDVNDTAESIFM